MDKNFVCEICGQTTPKECEGAEPNTCAMCMPLTNSYIQMVQKIINEFKAQNKPVDKQ